MFAKGNRGERERRDCQIESFKVLVTVTLQFRRDRREVMLAEASDMQVCKNDAVWDHFPPKSPARHRFGDHLIPRSPARHRFGDHLIPRSPHDAVFGD
jgi:hypothetical protein